MDRIAQRIRMAMEDVEMIKTIDQDELDALTDAVNNAKRVYVAGGDVQETASRSLAWTAHRWEWKPTSAETTQHLRYTKETFL